MASRNLGTLTVDLLLKMGGFKQGMDAAARETAAFEKRMAASFRSVGNAFKGLGAALGVGLSLDGLRRAASAAIEYGDEISKAASKTGIGVEQFSELAYAAKQTDIELNSLGTALKRMQVVMSEAASGSKSANETLTALGLTIGDLKQLAPERQFETLADRIAALKDPADRTRAAVELFGKAGADLLPLFEDGAAGIRAMREEAQRMGATLTGEQAAALAATDDSIKRLNSSFDGLARTLTAKVAPSFTLVFDAMSNALAQEPKVLSLAQAWEAVGNAFRKGGFGTSAIDILREAQSVGQPARSSSGLPPGGRNRTPFAPGFLPEPPKATTAAAVKANREAADALRAQAQAYEDVYTTGIRAIEGLRTPVEDQIAQYHETRYALEQLAATYPNLATEAAEAMQRLEMEGLEPIKITAEKIFPEQEQEKLGVFFEEASRNVQGLLADFLFDPFEDGLKGLAESFSKMLLRMAAEAAAAQIAQKLFGTGMGSGGGLSGGWMGALVGLAGAYFGGGSMNSQGIGLTSSQISQAFAGLSEGGYTGDGGKHQPAGIVHAGEFVTRSEVTRQPGAVSFLEAFNRVGMNALHALPGFASGGLVAPAVVPARGPRMPRGGAMSVTNNFTIHAPTGSVSRATETQIAAAAARGAGRASARNN